MKRATNTMKITKARLKEIIDQELAEMRRNPVLPSRRTPQPGSKELPGVPRTQDGGAKGDDKPDRYQRRLPPRNEEQEELEEGEEEAINEELTRQDKTDVKKMVQDELDKLLKKKDTKDQMGEIVKKVMKKLYKDLSLEHPYIIDRIKI
jgi:hypothetical protein